jgi:arsenate reductase
MKRRVLILCTGNSCRSQLAEAIVNARLGEHWQAFSAGTKPAGYVHPNALRALDEIGIRHAGRSKSVEEFKGQPFDLVVTVCDSAAEDCPVWLGQGKRTHLSFPDPAKATGSDEEVMAAFRAVRDDMAQRIPALLETETSRVRPDDAG